MDDPRGVRLGEPLARLEDVVDGLVDRDVALLLEDLREVVPVESSITMNG